MVALKAACTQQPPVGKIVGLDGSLFSKTVVNATDIVTAPPTSTAEPGKPGLSTGAYAGIGVAGAAIIAVIIAVCIIGSRKKHAREERDLISSGLDDRFGHGNITMPVKGAYGDPYASQHSPYHNVGLVTVPSPGEKGYGSQRDEQQTYDPHFPSPQYKQPHSQVAPISYANYNQARHHSPGLSYSPAGSTQPADTPSQSPRSISDSTTQLRGQASHNDDHSNLTRSNAPPRVSDNSPRYGLPARSNSRAAVEDASTFRPGRHTRDLSSSRDEEGSSNISGPIITVSTRFDEDDEIKKKQERERLYRSGFKTKEEEKAKSPDGEVWPGNY